MSRNLCDTRCNWCRCDEVELTGPEHPIAPEEAGRYFDEFAGMIVANAECMVCGAKYLAWVDETGRKPHKGRYGTHVFDRRAWEPGGFFDLSYRSTFNDEPGEADAGFLARDEVRQELRRLRDLVARAAFDVTGA